MALFHAASSAARRVPEEVDVRATSYVAGEAGTAGEGWATSEARTDPRANGRLKNDAARATTARGVIA